MGDQVATNVVKFSGKNWTTWKFQIQVILKSKGYYDIVTGIVPRPLQDTTEWDNKDAKAQEVVVTRLDEKVLTHILTCTSSAEMWTKLKTVYENQSQVSVHLLQQRFFSLEYEEGNAAGFISQIEEIKGNLGHLGEKISDKMAMTKVLMSLPESMKHFVSAWESAPSESQTLANLMSRLMIEEERNKSAEKSTALAAKSKWAKHKKDIKCFECKELGHVKRNCPRLKSKICSFCKKHGHLSQDCWSKKKKDTEEKENTDSDNKVKQAMVTVSSILNHTESAALFGDDRPNKHDWWMDSGATEHMCFDVEQFSSVKSMAGNRQVRVGNGTLVDVCGTGTVQVQAWNGSEWIETELNNVLLVPSLAVNLFSLSTALDKGFEMMSNKTKCEFMDRDGTVRAMAERLGNLYKMKFKMEEKLSQCNAVQSLTEWHRKLAHIHYGQVRKMLKENETVFNDEHNPFCADCLMGKQHRLPFPISDSRATKLCELIHADLCGPFEVPSLGGAKYFLLLKDDYSGYRKVYFLKNKSEVKEKIENFLPLAKNVTGNKIVTIRTDNGTEFVNQEVSKLCEKRGIHHEKTCVYTPQQNGRAEREMRTIVEAVRTMLNSKDLDKVFWAEAVNTVVFTLNRAGSSPQKDKTPYKAWCNKDCDLKIFKEFGTKVGVHIPKEKRRKLDPKSETGVFVGYSEEVKGYRIYLPHKEDVEIHRDVVFLPEVKTTEEMKNEIVSEEKVVTLDVQTEDHEAESHNEEVPDIDNFPEVDNEMDGSILETADAVPDSDTSDSFEDAYDTQEEDSNDRPGKRKIRKPGWMKDYDLSTDMVFYSVNEDAITYEEAMSGENSAKWKEAMEKELKVLRDNNTWDEVQWPVNKKVIESKWVFKVKGENEFKARLVARGFQQETDNSLYDIYAPVAKLTTFRMLLVVANILKRPIYQMDVKSAFLYGDITEEVYMALPSKNVNNSKIACKLNKSIYGLKKSPKCWNNKFDSLLKNKGFVRSEKDHCLYTKCSDISKLYVLLYVDDVLIVGTDLKQVQKLKQILNSNFSMKDLGLINQYLGIDVKQNLKEGYTEISQENYLKKVLKKYNMYDCKPVSTPMDANNPLESLISEENNPKMQKLCRKIIGSLMYAVQGTRPDLCVSVNILSRFQDKAGANLLKALKRVLRYVKGTLGNKLVLKVNSNNGLCAYVDSDWGGDVQDRKSTTGYIFKLCDCSIAWASQKQQCVAISSTESEYRALSIAVTEAGWMKRILKEFNVFDKDNPVLIHEDNQSAIRIAYNPENSKRLRHVDIRLQFITEEIDKGVVSVVHIGTEDQVADIFTKPLARAKFEKFRRSLGLSAN